MKFVTILLVAIAVSALSGVHDGARWGPTKGGCPYYSGTVFLASSKNRGGLNRIITRYRGALGGVDNLNDAGPLRQGHRSINWDADVVPFNMPADFFKNTVTRGALFRAARGKFAVSNPASGPPNDNRFSSFNPGFPGIFRTFSPKRLFTPVVKNVVSTFFSVPAKNDRASVSGFGAIFTNVVLRGKTKITFFDKAGCPIVTVAAPPRAKGLSFVGVIVKKRNNYKIRAAVNYVKITLGNAPITAGWGSGVNFVVLDDLIYGEPQAV